MSKTAQSWLDEGDGHRDRKNYAQAEECYNKAIALDPNNSYAYALKGYLFKQQSRFEEAAQNYQKAVDLGDSSSWLYHDFGFLYTFKIAKREEALKHYTRAMELDSSNLGALLLDRGNCFIALGRIADARKDFERAIENGSRYAETYSYFGGFLEEEGKKEKALETYNQGLDINSNDLNCGLLKANILNELGRKDESLQMYQHLLNLYPTEPVVNYRMGCLYDSLGNSAEAKRRYETGSNANATSTSAQCAKGQCCSMLGRHEQAMGLYKKVQQRILEPNRLEITLPTFMNKVKVAVKAVLEAEEASKKVEAETANLDQNNPAVQKFATNMKILQEKKKAAQNKVLDQVNKQDTTENAKELAKLDDIKEAFRSELEALKKEMGDFKKEVKAEITNIKDNMEEMREELNSKMDDFYKKLDIELDKQDLPDEDKTKLRAYFSAFIGTFSSAHVSAQVVDSGLVKLDSDSAAASVLSFMASFTPFVGSALQQGVKSIGDFLKSKEMKSNARKLKGLAPDAVALSKIVGKTGFTILMDKNKQKEVLTMTDKEMNKKNGGAFQKLFDFCEQITEKIDVYLYTSLYKTTAERIGHKDANDLIGVWTRGKIMPYDIEDQFIERLLNPPSEEEEKAEMAKRQSAPVENRSSCCNMF